MANTFVKLFQSILDSTVWQQPLPTKVVWITLLAMCDRDGKVWASRPGLAVRAGVDLKECEEALSIFLAPDPYSRTKDNEGRRIEEIDGGWRLLNHEKYRRMLSIEERREYQRAKQAEYRKRRAETRREAQKEGARQAINEGFSGDSGEPTGVDLRG